MVFSVDTVINSKNTKLSNPLILDESEFDFDKSLFAEALEIISDGQNDFFTEMNELLTNEGIASNMVNNSLKEFDFRTILEKIFDLFVAAIERLGASFCSFLLNFVNDDAELKMYKNKLSMFRGSVHYNKPYYEYKNLGIDTSVALDYKRDIDDVYNEVESSLKSFSNISNKEDLNSAFTNLLSSYNESDKLSKIRGRLCNQQSVSADDYADSLFSNFRTTDEPIDPRAKFYQKNIKGDRVHLAYKDFFDSSKQISIIKRDQWKFKAQATAEKMRLRTIKASSYFDNDLLYNASNLVAYNRIISYKCKEIKEICNIYVLYYSAKLDAIKQYNRTNKEILLLACKAIAKEDHLHD